MCSGQFVMTELLEHGSALLGWIPESHQAISLQSSPWDREVRVSDFTPPCTLLHMLDWAESSDVKLLVLHKVIKVWSFLCWSYWSGNSTGVFSRRRREDYSLKRFLCHPLPSLSLFSLLFPLLFPCFPFLSHISSFSVLFLCFVWHR